jgi:serpin B
MEARNMRSKKLLTTLLAGSILLGGLTSCSNTAAPSKLKNVADPKPEIDLASVSNGDHGDYQANAAAEGYNKYALKLFADVAKAEGKDVNIMVSPASVMFALDLADAGACKNTLAEINKAIGGEGLTPEQQQAFASQWMKDINSSDKVSFSVANAIWSNNQVVGDKLNPDYVKFIEKMYEAKAKTMNFDGAAVEDINKWVNDKTKGMIDNIISRLDPQTAAVLVNAIAFEGVWEEPYEDYQVQPWTFKGTSGESDMTGLTEASSYYYESDKATGFSKLYDGGKYKFVAILPKDEKSDANTFMAGFTPEDYSKFIGSATWEYEVHSKIPKFKNEYDVILNDALKDLGINDAFDPEKADFTGIAHTEENMFISQVLHKTFIELDEKGTKAAAATAITMETASAEVPMKKLKEVICDRPFAYMIVDCENDKPIFIGTVNNI